MKKEGEEQISAALAEVLATSEGVVIPHSKLRILGNIATPNIEEFADQHEFLEAVKLSEFNYLGFIEKLKSVLLTEHKICLKNERGVGYFALPPKEQIEYGIRRTKNAIRKKVGEGRAILEHVRWNAVSLSERKNANDSSARMSMLRQMLNGKG